MNSLDMQRGLGIAGHGGMGEDIPAGHLLHVLGKLPVAPSILHLKPIN